MTESATAVYAPKVPSHDTLTNPSMMIRDATGAVLCVYCPKNKCGGLYDLQLHGWTIFGPLTADEFVRALPRLNVRIADGPDLQVWLNAIAAPSVRPN